MNERTITLDEAFLPAWFRKKTYNFPFLNLLFTGLLVVCFFWFINTLSTDAYERGRRDAIQGK